jgi:peptidoglycan/LPS O-acetylase OafA/YrhL
MKPLKYRSDIDGLRAVAVLGVVIYHAFPKLIPGGFIGVDIFFVISGYLISGILYKGHNRGNFSPSGFFLEFYARRIRRLFPALITMLVITLAYGWMILLPDEFQQLGKHVAAGTLFIQNIVFWQESGYFDTAASLKPLLHLWSLAVEEQFYIFFPLLLILLWRKPRLLVPAMGVLLISTFILNIVMSVQNSVSDFFLTPYRAWEFLGGSLLAWWHYDKGHEEEVPPYREALSWCGVVLLGLGMAFIHTGDPYPGWRALLPVAGTLLLMEGGRSAWVNRKILSNPAVVWIGLISYPLYLFHWPALSFVHIVKGEDPKVGYIFAALGTSFLLTIATYYLVERPLRHHHSRWVIPSLLAAFLTCAAAGLLIWKEKIPFRPVPREMSSIPEAVNDKEMLDHWKWTSPLGAKVLLCNAGGKGPQTVILGDSNAQQYAPRLYQLVAGNSSTERGVQYVTSGGTPPIPGVANQKVEGCRDLIPTLSQIISKDPRIDRVVIAAWWHGYFFKDSQYTYQGVSLGNSEARKRALQSLFDLIQDLRGKNKQVILVTSIPTGRLLDPKHLHARGFTGLYPKKSTTFSKQQFLDTTRGIIQDLKEVGIRSGAEVVDPLDYLCTNGTCIAEDEQGIPIRYDSFHLRPGYVRDHVKYLDRTVQP